jgi:hypothetical protein
LWIPEIQQRRFGGIQLAWHSVVAVNRQKLPAADRTAGAERQNSPFSGAGGGVDQSVRLDSLIEAQGVQLCWSWGLNISWRGKLLLGTGKEANPKS